MKYTEFLERAHHGFVRRESEGVVYFAAPALEELGFLTHGFTSRVGGVSLPPYDTLNLSFTRTPDAEAVRENFRRAARALDIAFEKLVVCHYCHGSNIETARTEHHGMGITRENTLPFCDGLMVVDADTAAVTLHGDCGAIFFADRQGRAAGVCHSGWRGTAMGIAAKAVAAMCREFGCDPAGIRAAIGPCIGLCCFEVGPEVPEAMRNALGADAEPFFEPRGEKYHVDLKGLNRLWLERAGLSEIDVCPDCTRCQPERFWSHRAVGNQRGSQAAIIMRKE